ncbi:hypothetical protein PNI0159_01288 [Streptococcus pneumoniae PNI0159]|nr:hypothetical protein PNI0159_01288 [Streptococcus pneumoniae PNI0159]
MTLTLLSLKIKDLYSSKISSNRVNVGLTSSVYLQPQCFEQPATSFLVCSLIFIEY